MTNARRYLPTDMVDDAIKSDSNLRTLMRRTNIILFIYIFGGGCFHVTLFYFGGRLCMVDFIWSILYGRFYMVDFV